VRRGGDANPSPPKFTRLKAGDKLLANATSIDYAARLWQVFHAMIAGALDEMKILLGDMVAQVMKAIEQQVQRFFVQALQLDARTLRLEAI